MREREWRAPGKISPLLFLELLQPLTVEEYPLLCRLMGTLACLRAECWCLCDSLVGPSMAGGEWSLSGYWQLHTPGSGENYNSEVLVYTL